MRTRRWIQTTLIAVTAATMLGAGHPISGSTITGGTPAQQAMGRWAQARFADQGLALPPLEIRFHAERTGCYGRLGYFVDGVASMCGTHVDPMARRTLLHEMAHGWIESNVSPAEQLGFLDLRGLSTWNDPDVDWEERGFEQAADIIAWALHDQGTGTSMPPIPDNDLEQLTEAYTFLTSDPLPMLPGGPFSR
jgi:hypothetical protein